MATVIHLPIARPGEPTIATSSTTSSATYDVAINGIGYLLAAKSGDSSLARATAPYKKDQFDTSNEAGEQSLESWWRRNQASFHGGAGLLYFEQSGNDEKTNRVRFHQSKNVDPWTPGKLHRLPDTELVISSGSTCGGLVGARRGTDNYAVAAFGSSLSARKITDAGVQSTVSYTWGGATTVQSLASDGKSYWAAASTGIYSGPIDNGSPGAKVWDGGTTLCVGWVKQRLMAGIDHKVYELVGGTPPTLPAAKYTHPNTDWRWTCFAESPRGILAAGYSGDEAAVYLFELDSSGVAPTLTSGVVAVQLPTGERVYSMGTFAGATFAVGTNRGVRVGAVDVQGNVVLGPLSITATTAIRGLAARGDYLYATGTALDPDGESGLLRLDMGFPVDDAGRVAYANDLLCPAAQTADCSAVAVVAGRMVFTVDGYGLVLGGTSPGTARDAWLRTSRIRFTTIEPKLFKRAQVRGDFPATFDVYALTPAIVEQAVLSATAVASDPPEFTLPEGSYEWLQLRFHWPSLLDTPALNTNSTFEQGTTGWTGYNGTFTVQTSTVYEGSYSGRHIPDGVSVTSYVEATDGAPVTPGTSYTANARVYAPNPLTAAGVAVNWYNSSGVYLSTSSTTGALAAGAWTFLQNTYTAPPDAATGHIHVVNGGTPPIANGMFFDRVELRQAGLGSDTELRSWMVKALPATKRQRLIQLTLRMGDSEADRGGLQVGGRGSGFTRLRALEALEEVGDVIIYESRLPYSRESRLCVIDRVVFEQAAQPTQTSGLSGTAMVTLRTVD